MRFLVGALLCGVLLAATGPDKDVLKIRPPLVFSVGDSERLVDALDAVLSSLEV